MGLLTQIGAGLVDTAFGLYILLVWLRFLLQLVHADFYNPISQFVVKATSPLLHPLRRIIPSVGGMDSAAIVLIVLLFMLKVAVVNMILGGGAVPPLTLIMATLFGLLNWAAQFYYYLLFLSVILSWVAPGSYAPAAVLVYQLAEPVLAPFRKLLPAMGGLDLSPMIAFFAIYAFQEMLVIAFKHFLPGLV